MIAFIVASLVVMAIHFVEFCLKKNVVEYTFRGGGLKLFCNIYISMFMQRSTVKFGL